jgi:DNA-binding transcriptional MerR regulator
MKESRIALSPDWTGTAAQLAQELIRLLPTHGLPAEPAPSERLVRFYVSTGVLSRPQRDGREARFGTRQAREFLATRALLEEGWPLAKVAELLPTCDDAALEAFLPPATSRPTRAQELVASFLETRSAAPTLAAPAPATRRPPDNPGRQEWIRLSLISGCELSLQTSALERLTDDDIERAVDRCRAALTAELARKGRSLP